MPNPKQYLQKEIIPGNNLSWDTDGVTLNADVPRIEANPQETPTDTLESLELDGTVYGLGGGTEVEANPSDPATDTLSTIDIAGTVYSIEGSGGGGISYDYYLHDGNIGGGPGSTAYATVPLDKSLTEGVYIAYTIDSNGTTGNTFFTWGGTNKSLTTGSITYTLSETAATATNYSGNWRDIFLTIFKLNSGGGTGSGGFSAPDYENPETITLVLNTWVTYNVTENGYIMVDMGGFIGNATTIKVNNTVLSADKSADTGYFLNSTYMFPVMTGDVVELYLNYNSAGYSSNTALFFPAKNGGGGGGGTGNLNAVEMDYEDWLALPQDEREDPNIEYFLSNAPGGGGGTGDLSAMELTQNQYNNLPTAQKLDDKELYFINNNITTEEAIDVTDFVNKRETAVTITADSSTNSLIYAWNGNSDIGAQSVYPTIISANVTRIDYKIITGTSYSTSDNRFKIGIGVRATYDTTNFIMTNDSGWEAIDIYNIQNDVIEGSLDLSEINTDTYLYIIGHGWNMTVEDLTIVTVNESTDPTKIMYKDVEYGSGGGGGSGELVADVIWEGPSTPTTSGTVITLDKSWEDYDFLVFEIKQGSEYSSTPMIYLKNIETNVKYIQTGYGYSRFDAIMTLLTSTTMKIERTSSSGVETTYSKIYGLKFNSGGGGSTGGGNLYGTTDPTNDLGNNGDIYMKYQGGSEPVEGETETLTNVYLEITKGNDWVALPNFDTSLYYSVIFNHSPNQVLSTKINISDISTDANNPTIFGNTYDDLYGYINNSTLYLKTVIWNTVINSAIVTLNVFQPPQILNTYGKVEDEWVGFPGGGSTSGGFYAPDYENPTIINLTMKTWNTYVVPENGYIMLDITAHTGTHTQVKVNGTTLSLDYCYANNYMLNATYMFPVMKNDVVELYPNYEGQYYASNTAKFFPALNGGNSESLITTYYARNAQISDGTNKQFITVQLDQPIEEGSDYVMVIKNTVDGTPVQKTFFNYLNFGNYYSTTVYGGSSIKTMSLQITSTSISCTNYEGSWQDIYIDVYKTVNRSSSSKSFVNYSTDEQMIGTWIDGKPIYQKTWQVDQSIHTYSPSWSEKDLGIAVSDYDINMIVKCFLWCVDNTDASTKGCIQPEWTRIANGSIHVSMPSGWNANVKSITIQYTKTTD